MSTLIFDSAIAAVLVCSMVGYIPSFPSTPPSLFRSLDDEHVTSLSLLMFMRVVQNDAWRVFMSFRSVDSGSSSKDKSAALKRVEQWSRETTERRKRKESEDCIGLLDYLDRRPM